jgi:hypothetical protein
MTRECNGNGLIYIEGDEGIGYDSTPDAIIKCAGCNRCKPEALEASFHILEKGHLGFVWDALAAYLRSGLPGKKMAGLGYDEQLVHDIANAVREWKNRQNSGSR